MSSATVFSKSVLKTKKKNKLKLLFLFSGRIIRNNPKLFFFCSLLAVITAIINFNIGVSFKDAFLTDEKTLSAQTIEIINQEVKEKEGKEGEISTKRIQEIVDKQTDQNVSLQRTVQSKIVKKLKEKDSNQQKTLKKKEATELIKEASKDNYDTIFKTNGFKFKFNFFG